MTHICLLFSMISEGDRTTQRHMHLCVYTRKKMMPCSGFWTQRGIFTELNSGAEVPTEVETEVPTRFMKISNGRGDREGESESKCINAPNQEDFCSHSSFVRHQNPCWRPSMNRRCVGYQASWLFTSLYCNCLATKGRIRKDIRS